MRIAFLCHRRFCRSEPLHLLFAWAVNRNFCLQFSHCANLLTLNCSLVHWRYRSLMARCVCRRVFVCCFSSRSALQPRWVLVFLALAEHSFEPNASCLRSNRCCQKRLRVLNDSTCLCLRHMIARSVVALRGFCWCFCFVRHSRACFVCVFGSALLIIVISPTTTTCFHGE